MTLGTTVDEGSSEDVGTRERILEIALELFKQYVSDRSTIVLLDSDDHRCRAHRRLHVLRARDHHDSGTSRLAMHHDGRPVADSRRRCGPWCLRDRLIRSARRDLQPIEIHGRPGPGRQPILIVSLECRTMLRPSNAALAIGVLTAVILLSVGQHLAAAQDRPKADAHPKAVEAHGRSQRGGRAGWGAWLRKPDEGQSPPSLSGRSSSSCCLLAILTKFAWKPLMHALDEREKHLEHVLHETERARNESETLLARAPQADGPRGRRGSRPPRQGAARTAN